jgi:hypothetical protein
MPRDSDDYPDRFAIVPLPDGPAPANAIAVGPLSMAMEYLPQSHARDKREREADSLTMRALKTVADVNLRADAVIEREREVRAQADAAQAIMSDAVRRFVDDVIKLGHRFDEFERRSIQAKLDALPNPDAAPDDGDLEVKPAKTEVETVLGDQNPGDLPNELETGAPSPPGIYFDPDPDRPRERPEPRNPAAISLNAADALDRSRFLSRAAWKAAKRQHRASLGANR